MAEQPKVGLKLTGAQRKLLLDLICLDDDYAEVVRDTPGDQPVQLTLDQWDSFAGCVAAEANQAEDEKVQKQLDVIVDKVQKVLAAHWDEEPLTLKFEDARKAKAASDRLQEVAAAPQPAESKAKKAKAGPKARAKAQPKARAKAQPKAKAAVSSVYQFKITLLGVEPPVWRRIQVKDCTLDKLHEHIQTAMGWTNSHLHQFRIGDAVHGDPGLLIEGLDDDPKIVDSLGERIVEIVPEDGKRFRFAYEYDFGDGWEHEILFEGRLSAEKGGRYPLCLEGSRACPPDDIGGIFGYQEYIEAMADPKHQRHDELLEWRGPFDPEAFDAEAVTKRMRRGLPNWREME
jgi:hypothetical protein